MLLPLVVVGAAYLVGRSHQRTFTNIERRELLGPSGTLYKAEIFPSIPLLALQCPDGSEVHFEGTGLKFARAHGDPETVQRARSDFEGTALFKTMAKVTQI